MTSIDRETLLTPIFVEGDDWYQKTGRALLQGKASRKPPLRDREGMTLRLADDSLPYPAETQYLESRGANHGRLFPHLLDQSPFKRRARRLRYLIELRRRAWLMDWGVEPAAPYLMDTNPIPLMGYKRSKKRRDLAGSAAYGDGARRPLPYFGYQRGMITTLDGLPVISDRGAAHPDDRQAAEAVLDRIANPELIGDQGFVGVEWQAPLKAQTGKTLLTPHRKNQKSSIRTALNAC